MSKDFIEKRYITQRKIRAFFYSILYYMCSMFSIRKNKVVFWTFEGAGGFCCNPKYIAEEIIKRGGKYELVWLVDDMSYKFPEEIKKKKNTLWNRLYQLATAKIWIGNSRTVYGTRKRKGQIYIQTWHGTVCIKPIGKYRGKSFPEIAQIVSEADSKLIDYVLSGSDWCDFYYRDGLLYDGEIIRTGTPRCDVLFHGKKILYQKIREEYKIPVNAKILLYAPTFRGGSQSTNRSVMKVDFSIRFDQVIDELERRFGGEWYVFLRLHPQLASKMKDKNSNYNSGRVIDVTQRPDMNELIVSADAFISDYSSAIFEAALLKMPCYIYVEDYDEYIKDRGNLFFDLNDLPFPVAKDNGSLIVNISSFNKEEYEEEVDKFIKKVGICENGKASKEVVDLIEAFI